MHPVLHDDPDGRGDRNERHFLAAAKRRTKATPKWFRRVIRSSPGSDTRGIDMIARIKRTDDWKPMSVPLQIKSSASGRASFYDKHPEARTAGVPVLIVNERKSADAIRADLYRTLEPFLTVPRHHFKNYLESLHRRRLTKRGKLIKKHIKKTRKASWARR